MTKRKSAYRRGEVMTWDCDLFLVKGNLTDEEFRAVEIEHGYDPSSPEKIQRGWRRCVPTQDGDFDFYIYDAEPHTRGAFEATWVVR